MTGNQIAFFHHKFLKIKHLQNGYYHCWYMYMAYIYKENTLLHFYTILSYLYQSRHPCKNKNTCQINYHQHDSCSPMKIPFVKSQELFGRNWIGNWGIIYNLSRRYGNTCIIYRPATVFLGEPVVLNRLCISFCFAEALCLTKRELLIKLLILTFVPLECVT